MRKILIVKENGRYRVTVAYSGMGCELACSWAFRRLSHRAWGFIRRAMGEGAEG